MRNLFGSFIDAEAVAVAVQSCFSQGLYREIVQGRLTPPSIFGVHIMSDLPPEGNIREIAGFEGIVVLPVPRRIYMEQRFASIGLHAYLEMGTGGQRTRVTHVLVILTEDILGLRLPPHSVPIGWAEFVEHVRRLPPREVDDTVWLPILSREEGARDALVAWGVEVHRHGRQGPIPPFPWSSQPPSPPVHAVTDSNREPAVPCIRCGQCVNAAEIMRLPCERCRDQIIHHSCAEDIARMSRREVGGVVVVPCPRCGEEYQVAEMVVIDRITRDPCPSAYYGTTTTWIERRRGTRRWRSM